jgi:clan AA aspartic protease
MASSAPCYDGRAMGLTHVRASVARPGSRQRPVRVRFLIDTGAVYTVLPEAVWRRLRLRPERTAEFTLADGTTITRGVSECRFTVEGHTATSPVILGGRGDAALLGAVTLETLGLMVNPLSREILPMRLMLATARPGRAPGLAVQHPHIGRSKVRTRNTAI